jgi:hypothetical protein
VVGSGDFAAGTHTGLGFTSDDAGNDARDAILLAIALRPAAAGGGPTIVSGAVSAVFSGTTVSPVLPTHAADDILVVQGWKNDASDLSVSGWTAIVSADNDSNLSTGWWWKRAASGSETDPTVSSSTSATSTERLYGCCYRIRNSATSGDPFEDATVNGSPTSSTTPAGATVTTTGDDRLVVTFALMDANTSWSTPPPPSTWATVNDEAT